MSDRRALAQWERLGVPLRQEVSGSEPGQHCTHRGIERTQSYCALPKVRQRVPYRWRGNAPTPADRRR